MRNQVFAGEDHLVTFWTRWVQKSPGGWADCDARADAKSACYFHHRYRRGDLRNQWHHSLLRLHPHHLLTCCFCPHHQSLRHLSSDSKCLDCSELLQHPLAWAASAWEPSLLGSICSTAITATIVRYQSVAQYGRNYLVSEAMGLSSLASLLHHAAKALHWCRFEVCSRPLGCQDFATAVAGERLWSCCLSLLLPLRARNGARSKKIARFLQSVTPAASLCQFCYNQCEVK